MRKSRYTIVNDNMIQLHPSNRETLERGTKSKKNTKSKPHTNNIINFSQTEKNNYVIRIQIYGLGEHEPLPNIVIGDYDPE